MLIKTHFRIQLFRQFTTSLTCKQLETTQTSLFINKLCCRRAAQGAQGGGWEQGSGTLRPACLSLACPSRPRGPLCFCPVPYSLPVIMRLTSEGAEAKTHVPHLLLELTYNLFWCLRCREQKWNALIFGSFPSKSPSSVIWARCFCPLSHGTLHHPATVCIAV